MGVGQRRESENPPDELVRELGFVVLVAGVHVAIVSTRPSGCSLDLVSSRRIVVEEVKQSCMVSAISRWLRPA